MEELYKVYNDSVAVQISVIAATREKLKKAKNAHNISETKRLESLLKVLYDEKAELEEKRRLIKEYLS
ncbi:MAG: hypothetical protein IKY78_09205 [Clostridia bacterium]|nr:hypothetical protein [Clostridia bacterium]